MKSIGLMVSETALGSETGRLCESLNSFLLCPRLCRLYGLE
jgi:hypothetical protein